MTTLRIIQNNGTSTHTRVEGRATRTRQIFSREQHLCDLGRDSDGKVVSIQDKRGRLFEKVPDLPRATFARRFDVSSLEQLKGQLRWLAAEGRKIELALPHVMDAYQRFKGQMRMVADELLANGVQVTSVHAVQASIADRGFLIWGQETLEMAERLGAKVITLHPDKIKDADKQRLADAALDNIRQLQQGQGPILAIETFSGKRSFSWQDLIRKQVPTVLDTSHIPFEQCLQMLGRARVVSIHLSSTGENRQHLPIDASCVRILKKLAAQKYSGLIVLEYLPEFESLYADDLARLQ